MNALIESTQELLRFAIAERDAFYDCSTDAEGNLNDPGDQAELERMDAMIDRARAALSDCANDREPPPVNLMFSTGHKDPFNFTASDRRFFVSYPAPSPDHIADAGTMIPVDEDTPEMGVPVIGYHPNWADPDFNDRGLRECFRFGDGKQWHSAKWFDEQDCYITAEGAPTHWAPMVPKATPSVPENEIRALEADAKRYRHIRKVGCIGNGKITAAHFDAWVDRLIETDTCAGDGRPDGKTEALPVRYYVISSEDEDLFEPDDDGLNSAMSKLADLEARHPAKSWDLFAVIDTARLRTAGDEGEEGQ